MLFLHFIYAIYFSNLEEVTFIQQMYWTIKLNTIYFHSILKYVNDQYGRTHLKLVVMGNSYLLLGYYNKAVAILQRASLFV